MITRYCGLVKGLNHNLCHFMPPKKQTKIILIFCALLQTKNNFQDIPRLLCAFPCILNSFSVHFPFDPLRSVKHNILWFLPHRLPPRFPLSPRRGAGRKQRPPRRKFPLKKAPFSPFFHFQSAAKHAIIQTQNTAARRRGSAALHRHTAARFLIQRRLPHEKENFRNRHR